MKSHNLNVSFFNDTAFTADNNMRGKAQGEVFAQSFKNESLNIVCKAWKEVKNAINNGGEQRDVIRWKLTKVVHSIVWGKIPSKFKGANYFALRGNTNPDACLISYNWQSSPIKEPWPREGRKEVGIYRWLVNAIGHRRVNAYGDAAIQYVARLLTSAFEANKIVWCFTESTNPDFHGRVEEAYSSIHKYNTNENSNGARPCMTDKPVSFFYSHFPVAIGMAFYLNDMNTPIARCWRWKLSDGETYYDRCYSIKDIHGSYHTLVKDHINYESNCDDGLSVEALKDVAMETHKMFYPYLDSFGFYQDGKLVSEKDDLNTDSPYYGMKNTNGTFELLNVAFDVDGEVIHDMDEYIEVDGDYYHNDDERIIYCDRSEEYVLTRETYTIETSRRETIIIHERFVTRNH